MPRYLYNVFLTLVLFSAGVSSAHAQQKIGYVNTDEILQQIPEYEGVQQQLEIISEGWRQKLDDMQLQIDSLQEEFEAKEILYSDEEQVNRRQEIQKLEKQRREFLNQKFGSKGEYFQKQQELLAPVQRSVYKAVTAVADRQNIDFVFDRAKNTSLLFGQRQWNLNEDVLQELGISLPQ